MDAALTLLFLVVAFLYLSPPLYVIFSSRSRGGAKFGWLLVVVCFSWIGFAVFLIVTQSPDAKAPASFDRVDPRF